MHQESFWRTASIKAPKIILAEERTMIFEIIHDYGNAALCVFKKSATSRSFISTWKRRRADPGSVLTEMLEQSLNLHEDF